MENLSDEAITAAFRKVDRVRWMFQLWSERLSNIKHTVYAVQDRSGLIDKTEIYNLLGTVFGDVPDQRMVTALIAHFDSNKDGKVAPPSLLLPFFRLSFTLPKNYS